MLIWEQYVYEEILSVCWARLSHRSSNTLSPRVEHAVDDGEYDVCDDDGERDELVAHEGVLELHAAERRGRDAAQRPHEPELRPEMVVNEWMNNEDDEQEQEQEEQEQQSKKNNKNNKKEYMCIN